MNQTDYIICIGHKENQVKIENVKKLSDVKLSDFPFEIHKIKWGSLCVGNGQVSDLWQFMIANRHQCPAVMQFSQRIEDNPLIDYFHDQLHKNKILFEMSNHMYANYIFAEYMLSCGPMTKIYRPHGQSLKKYMKALPTAILLT